jgi:signal recognition particle GTPase
VNVRLVAGLRNNIKKRVNMEELAVGLNKRKIIEKAVFDELCGILDSGSSSSSGKDGGKDSGKAPPPSWQLKKGRPAVVMFVGLQGSGKTTTCTKYAYWHKKKGWKPALVCADTFRAGALAWAWAHACAQAVRACVAGACGVLCCWRCMARAAGHAPPSTSPHCVRACARPQVRLTS